MCCKLSITESNDIAFRSRSDKPKFSNSKETFLVSILIFLNDDLFTISFFVYSFNSYRENLCEFLQNFEVEKYLLFSSLR